jgi:6-phosphogluconolactonase (cycloisomerase 2 family)
MTPSEGTVCAQVYASEGKSLHAFALDPESGALTRVGTLELPELVLYGAVDSTARFLYLSVSDRRERHLVMAVALDPATGLPSLHGAPLTCETGRVIHLSIDAAGAFLVLAHPQAQRLTVIALEPDGRLGRWLPASEEAGFFAHQAQLDPGSRGLVACALGADATDQATERPGELRAFGYELGRLTATDRVVLAPGLGARHLAYGDGRVYVVLERGNRLAVYDYAAGRLAATPRFVVGTLHDPDRVRPAQRAGAIHFHPNGRWLYVSNRANATMPAAAGDATAPVFAGGENAIALFVVDPRTGEPRLTAQADTLGIEPRTFTIDARGRFLVVANHSTLDELDADGRPRAIPRSHVVYRIAGDGRLERLHQYDRTDGDLFWIGAVGRQR